MSKLIFLDIDGTLTEAGTNIPPESAVEAMKLAKENGHKLFICTGRNYGMLRPLLVYPFDGVVSCAGGYVTVGDEVLFDSPMSDEMFKKTLKILHDNNIFCTIESKEGSYCDTNFVDFVNSIGGEGNSELIRWRKAITENLGIKTFDEYKGEPIYKFVTMARSREDYEACRPLLENDFNIVIQDSELFGCINGELLAHGFDKGKGVEIVAKHYGVPIEDTIGFGDSMNDLEMIDAVGHAVVMENGSAELKKHADEVCPAVNDDGIHRAFAKLGLI